MNSRCSMPFDVARCLACGKSMSTLSEREIRAALLVEKIHWAVNAMGRQIVESGVVCDRACQTAWWERTA